MGGGAVGRLAGGRCYTAPTGRAFHWNQGWSQGGQGLAGGPTGGGHIGHVKAPDRLILLSRLLLSACSGPSAHTARTELAADGRILRLRCGDLFFLLPFSLLRARRRGPRHVLRKQHRIVRDARPGCEDRGGLRSPILGRSSRSMLPRLLLCLYPFLLFDSPLQVVVLPVLDFSRRQVVQCLVAGNHCLDVGEVGEPNVVVQ